MKKLFLSILSGILSLCMLASCTTTEGPSSNSDTSVASKGDILVYLVGGQSNAVGNGYISDLNRSEQLAEYKDVLYYAGGEDINENVRNKLLYVTTVNGGQSRFTYSFGMELGMAKRFTQEFEDAGTKCAIIKYAKDGSNILKDNDKRDWNLYDNQGTGAHYSNFIDTVNAGLSALRAEGYNPVIKGFAWLQGESNHTLSSYRLYLEKIRDQARIDLNAPNMFFVMGEIAYENYGESNYVNNGIKEIAQAQSSLCSVVMCGNLPTRSKGRYGNTGFSTQTNAGGPYDYLHWSGAEMLQIGQMYAEAFITLDGLN